MFNFIITAAGVAADVATKERKKKEDSKYKQNVNKIG